MAFIWTYERNGATFAEVRTSEREKGIANTKSIPLYLGKVVDLEKGLFMNRKYGVFKYSIDSGVEKADIQDPSLVGQYRSEKLILDFGASYLLAEFSRSIGFWDIFRDTLPTCQDSLMAMVFFYIELSKSNRDASRWFDGSFSRVLFPSAQLQSQRISELLEKLGDEVVVRDFFTRYLSSVVPDDKALGILVDSSALPNSINFPLTAVVNHNGEISEQIRLIYIIDTITGLPLFFRYNAGNIVDITTLKATVDELKANGINIKHAIVDAGYCSDGNLKALLESKIRFLTRLPVNRKLYKDALPKYKDEVLSDECRYMYQDRAIGIKRIYSPMYQRRTYLYLCVDYNRRNDQITNFTKSAIDDNLSRDQWKSHTQYMGFFALISTDKLLPGDLLPLYYTRQIVEQIFDVNKNITNLLPLRTHNEDTFRGHIMLSFMAVVLYLKLNQCFKYNMVLTADNALLELRNLKCKIYEDLVLIKEMNKDMRTISKLTGITIPEKIKLPLL
jgi:hypothetical protein